MIFWILLGIISGPLIAFTIFGLLVPLFIARGYLTLDMNKVNKTYKETGEIRAEPYFFAEVPQGQVVIVMMGSKIRYCMMNDPTKRFAREGTSRQHADYWQLRNRERNEPLEDLFPWNPWTPWGWWKRYIYWTTGKVFTGIFWFQRLLFYSFEKLEMSILTRSEVEDPKKRLEEEGTFALHVEKSVSNHWRTRRFNRYVKAADNETAGFFKATAIINFLFETINPITAAFGTDAWYTTVDNKVRNETRQVFKRAHLDYLIGETRIERVAAEDKDELALVLRTNIAPELQNIAGMHLDPEIESVQVLDVIPQVTPETIARIQDQKLAEYDKNAMLTRADGEAGRERKILAAQIDEVNRGGAASALVMQARAAIEAAKSGKQTTVFVGGSTDKAILDTLQRQGGNQGNSDQSRDRRGRQQDQNSNQPPTAPPPQGEGNPPRT